MKKYLVFGEEGNELNLENIKKKIHYKIRKIWEDKSSLNVIFFIGAGFSMDFGMKTWDGYAEEKLEKAIKYSGNKISNKEKNFILQDKKIAISVANKLLGNKKNVVEKKIFSFNTSNVSDKLKKSKLNEKLKNTNAGFVTTNYDNILEKYYNLNYIDVNKLLIKNNLDRGCVYHIHGDVDNSSKLIETYENYFEQYEEYNSIWKDNLVEIFKNYYVIFAGYSLSDVEVFNSLIQAYKNRGEKNIKKHFFIKPVKKDEYGSILDDYYNNIGIKVLPILCDDNDYSGIKKSMEYLSEYLKFDYEDLKNQSDISHDYFKKLVLHSGDNIEKILENKHKEKIFIFAFQNKYYDENNDLWNLKSVENSTNAFNVFWMYILKGIDNRKFKNKLDLLYTHVINHGKEEISCYFYKNVFEFSMEFGKKYLFTKTLDGLKNIKNNFNIKKEIIFNLIKNELCDKLFKLRSAYILNQLINNKFDIGDELYEYVHNVDKNSILTFQDIKKMVINLDQIYEKFNYKNTNYSLLEYELKYYNYDFTEISIPRCNQDYFFSVYNLINFMKISDEHEKKSELINYMLNKNIYFSYDMLIHIIFELKNYVKINFSLINEELIKYAIKEDKRNRYFIYKILEYCDRKKDYFNVLKKYFSNDSLKFETDVPEEYKKYKDISTIRHESIIQKEEINKMNKNELSIKLNEISKKDFTYDENYIQKTFVATILLIDSISENGFKSCIDTKNINSTVVNTVCNNKIKLFEEDNEIKTINKCFELIEKGDFDKTTIMIILEKIKYFLKLKKIESVILEGIFTKLIKINKQCKKIYFTEQLSIDNSDGVAVKYFKLIFIISNMLHKNKVSYKRNLNTILRELKSNKFFCFILGHSYVYIKKVYPILLENINEFDRGKSEYFLKGFCYGEMLQTSMDCKIEIEYLKKIIRGNFLTKYKIDSFIKNKIYHKLGELYDCGDENILNEILKSNYKIEIINYFIKNKETRKICLKKKLDKRQYFNNINDENQDEILKQMISFLCENVDNNKKIIKDLKSNYFFNQNMKNFIVCLENNYNNNFGKVKIKSYIDIINIMIKSNRLSQENENRLKILFELIKKIKKGS